MKMSRTLLLGGLLILSAAVAAQPALTAEQEVFLSKIMSGINTRHVNWVKTTAAEVKAQNLTEQDIRNRATRYAASGIKDPQDIEALIGLVMQMSAKDQQEDLKAIMAKVKALNEQKAKLRELLAKMQQQRTITAIQLDSFKMLQSRTVALKNGQNPDAIKFTRSSSRFTPPAKAELDALVDKAKNDLDSMSEMGEMESLRLQMAMDRKSKMMSTLSNLLKKISKTSEEIVQNLK